ncbi:MAG TPA: hemerythrin domain-containing protein [Chloroflexota bacterium]|nr:hemerythrin domain-containing protein [Chloroflexota bacterium]
MPTTTTKKRTTASRSKSTSAAKRPTAKASSSRSTGSAPKTPHSTATFPGALGLLHHDHEEVEKMLEEFEKAKGQEQMELARRICMELTIHALLEEQSFYPLIMEMGAEFKDMVLEAHEEHRQVKELIGMLEGSRPTEERFEPRMKVLMDDVLHHVQEEEKQLFPKLKKQVNKTRMEQWGQELEQVKTRLRREQGGMPAEKRMTEEVRERARA